MKNRITFAGINIPLNQYINVYDFKDDLKDEDISVSNFNRLLEEFLKENRDILMISFPNDTSFVLINLYHIKIESENIEVFATKKDMRFLIGKNGDNIKIILKKIKQNINMSEYKLKRVLAKETKQEPIFNGLKF